MRSQRRHQFNQVKAHRAVKLTVHLAAVNVFRHCVYKFHHAGNRRVETESAVVVGNVFDGEIVIIDNPLFESNVPSPLSLEQAVALFEYMQTDGKAENDTLEVLNRYYHEVNFLDAEHVLVALANVHEDTHYLRLPLFDNKDLTEMAMINQPADEILEGNVAGDFFDKFSVAQPRPLLNNQGSKSLPGRNGRSAATRLE